ncbi:ADP-ribosylglycohydrolase family protein, partial [bacterium]
ANKYAGNEIKRPTLGFALASVVYSIYLAVLHTDGFEKAVVAAINSGGDTDTMGAMVGAMCGALHGAEAIPERWLRGLANRKQITIRAEALADKKWPGGRAEVLYEMEYGLTHREQQERLSLMHKKGVDFPEKKNKQKKYAGPEPITEKFDQKRYKRQQRRIEKWKKQLPPDMLDKD